MRLHLEDNAGVPASDVKSVPNVFDMHSHVALPRLYGQPPHGVPDTGRNGGRPSHGPHELAGRKRSLSRLVALHPTPELERVAAALGGERYGVRVARPSQSIKEPYCLYLRANLVLLRWHGAAGGYSPRLASPRLQQACDRSGRGLVIDTSELA